MKIAFGIACCLLLGAVALPAYAAPRSISDCEKLKDDDAYNKCLASFGPRRGAARSRKGYRPLPGGVSRRGVRARGSVYRGISIYRSRGRVRTIIAVPRRKRRQ